jgi:hypothetical protein
MSYHNEVLDGPKIKLDPANNPHGIVASGSHGSCSSCKESGGVSSSQPDSLYDTIEQMVSSAGMIRPAFLTAHEQIAANYGYVLSLFYTVQIVRNKVVADSSTDTNDVIALNELSRDYAARAKGLHTALVSLYGLVDVDLVVLSDDVAEAAEHIATERAEWLFKKPGFSISDL